MPVKLTCPDCGKVCVGQTGRCFTRRFEEHFLCIRKKSTTEIAQHLLEHGHSFDTVESIVKILHFKKKGAHLDTIGKLCIYKEIMKNRPLNGNLLYNATEFSKPFSNVKAISHNTYTLPPFLYPVPS